ncbi:hypothetical protein ACHAQH_000709 [Verticillium albo-atrum]
MGSSSSKAASGAARKFPTRSPGAAVPPAAARQPQRAPPRPQASSTKDEAIRADAADPEVTADFSARLHQMGIAQPNPTYSPSSHAHPAPAPASPSSSAGPVFPSARNNSTLGALEARRLAEIAARTEFEALGRKGFQGREYLDLNTIVQMHLLRDRGLADREIEKRFNLKEGVVARLGRRGITVPASMAEAEA